MVTNYCHRRNYLACRHQVDELVTESAALVKSAVVFEAVLEAAFRLVE